MPSHSETRQSPYSPEQLMAMVLDVEKYPEFLPWCRAARILEQHDDYFLGELVISFNHLTERYTSKVMPLQNEIKVALVKGPFKHLTNHWRFIKSPTGGTDIHFNVEFEFKSKLLNSLMGSFFTKAVEKMSSAFLQRADFIYKN
jgi:coenzyme Q-binding protein COQ10